jgi:hypothetical protein
LYNNVPAPAILALRPPCNWCSLSKNAVPRNSYRETQNNLAKQKGKEKKEEKIHDIMQKYNFPFMDKDAILNYPVNSSRRPLHHNNQSTGLLKVATLILSEIMYFLSSLL